MKFKRNKMHKFDDKSYQWEEVYKKISNEHKTDLWIVSSMVLILGMGLGYILSRFI